MVMRVKSSPSPRRRNQKERLAGGSSIGLPYETPMQAAELVKAGLPFTAIGRLQKSSGLTLDRIKHVARISEGSFARRKDSGKLSLEQSERILRISRVFEQAASLFSG